MKERQVELKEYEPIPQVFEIEGGHKLEGTISAGGSKNAAFPVLAGAVLLDEPIQINNVPRINDVDCFIEILDEIGAKVERVGENSVKIDPRTINTTVVPTELGNKIRGSYYFLGALLSKFDKASIPQPGGCSVGERPMEQHFIALEKLGFQFEDGEESTTGTRHSSGEHTSVTLPFPSRGTTINTLLAASLQDGHTTEIINYNKSPETLSLVDFLTQSGADIEQYEDRIFITGKDRLSLNNFDVIPDKIEVATLLTAGLITKGSVTVDNVHLPHIRVFLEKLEKIGINCEIDGNTVTARYQENAVLNPVDVISGLNPLDIDADFEPILAALLCSVQGNSRIEDAINPARHSKYIPYLNNLGANITEESETIATIHGGTSFRSGVGIAHDIRGGVAQMLAMLSSGGTSYLANISQIQRGYEGIDEKINKLGGRINRVNGK